MSKSIKTDCSVPGCTRKGQSSGEYLCPDHWKSVSKTTKAQFRRARDVAQRNPLALNIAVMKRAWRAAVREAIERAEK